MVPMNSLVLAKSKCLGLEGSMVDLMVKERAQELDSSKVVPMVVGTDVSSSLVLEMLTWFVVRHRFVHSHFHHCYSLEEYIHNHFW